MENGGEELQRRQQEHQAMMEEVKTRGSKDREALQRRHEEEVSDVWGVSGTSGKGPVAGHPVAGHPVAGHPVYLPTTPIKIQ